MAYVPMPWESAPDQTKWSVNLSPPGAPPYYVATSNQSETILAQTYAWAEGLSPKPKAPVATKGPVGDKSARGAPPTVAAQSTRMEGVAVAAPIFNTYQPRTIVPRSPGVRGSIVPTIPISTGVQGSKTGDVIDIVGTAACSNISDTVLKSLCLAGVEIGTKAAGGRGSTGTTVPTVQPDARSAGLQPTSCPTGYEPTADGKGCKRTGIVGGIERILPGGDTGMLSDVYGEAVMGAMGIPALYPAVVGSISRNDGSTGAVLRCPAGTVLGRDDLCYMKGAIPRNWRKHPPGTKPFLTGGQVRILRKAKGLESRFKRLTSGKGALFKKAPKCGSCSRKKK